MTALEASHEEMLACLARSRAFSHLQRDILSNIIALARPVRFGKGSQVLIEGQHNRNLYFILRGSVSVYTRDRFVCRYGRAGDVFGEMSVISESPTSATVVAEEEVHALVIDGAVAGSFKSAEDRELVTVFYKLFSLSLLEKLKLTTLKARLFEDAMRHVPLGGLASGALLQDRSVEKRLHDTLLISLAVYTAGQAIVVTDAHGRITRVNLAAENLVSLIELQVIGKPIAELCDAESYRASYARLLNGELNSWSGLVALRRSDGESLPTRMSISTVTDDTGQRLGLLSIITDISKEVQLEQQLRRTQKLEAMGQLAGGIAHDFNNLLQIIISFTDFALKSGSDTESARADLERVLDAALRGADLTARLLAFSRKRRLSIGLLDVNALLHDLAQLLRRVIGERIALSVRPGAGLWEVQCDASLLEQALTNLCINARDAMPDGGELVLSSDNVEVGETSLPAHGKARPGQYVRIRVSDTGAGIPAEHLERIFEPFFTTKEPGRGTGLGLPMALGIVEQHEGFVLIDSVVGVGTTLSIHLPRSAPAARPAGLADLPPVRGGSETILLVEDDAEVRAALQRVLTGAGYRVLSATDGAQGEEMFRSHLDAIDLVLLDAIMPRMNGRELYEALKSLRPTLPVIFISSYSQESIGADFFEANAVRFIPKPFAPSRLLAEVRAEFESGAAPV